MIDGAVKKFGNGMGYMRYMSSLPRSKYNPDTGKIHSIWEDVYDVQVILVASGGRIILMVTAR